MFKKRLSNNQYRSIILARGGAYWVYEFMFAKQDMADIDEGDLARLRILAKAYSTLDGDQVAALVADKAWTEICQGELKQVELERAR